MTEMMVPFARPYFSDEDLDQILSEIRATLKSGWLTSGKNVARLEEEFAQYIGASYAVALNSCTAALHAILQALDVKKGDEVIVPSNTFVATANVAVYLGARPVFADSDSETFNISAEDVKGKITPRTKAIIPVHLAGNPCDMEALAEISQDRRISLVEDCAHAHGAQYRGKKCGTFGVASAFSFYPTKIMTTGEGGMVTTDDRGLAEKIKRIRNHGRGGYGPVEITDLGYNYRMPDVQAVIGLSQLRHIDRFLADRQMLARRYLSFLDNVGWMRAQRIDEGNLSSYYAFVVKLTEEAPCTRDDLMRRLGEKGVATSVLYYPVHTQPYYRGLFGNNVDCPVASDLGENSLALPIYNGMREAEISYVKSQLAEITTAMNRPVAGTN